MSADIITITQIEAVAVRAPIDTPVRTSFGTMTDRPAVFIEVRDNDGHRGLGEVWCNFPSVGAEHRARLALATVGPLLKRLSPLVVGEVFTRLMEALHVLALQSGEWGPLRQVSAGFDIACHDLAARRAGLPLHAYLRSAYALGSPDGRRVRAYASGIGPERPAEVAATEQARGHRAFKLKVGFGEEVDRRSLDAVRAAIGDEPTLMIDANQGWTRDEAILLGRAFAPYELAWLEEPLAADRPRTEWQAVAEAIPIPLAAGENMNATAEFETAIESGTLHFIQPDAAKWGGLSGCLDVARKGAAAGMTYSPHYLGGGIGLLASAHLLAAAGGDGLLEIDTNPNPWRDCLVGGLLPLADGYVQLSDAPGLGLAHDLEALTKLA
ncbi:MULTISPECIES: mandelate racemase/muconate lactonizing enzyme family protein [unclassified Chelatococcus]|uniref:mandelate racemase/muconate lactonizing enzyme family protein n=1 Tax=unclassified Chelatococcus TaxID=2638111 RepID=UPI001BCDD7B2|nr:MULTISPECIES: mandelate racemase/muconate lactonizing enzyme family protein [unclassified Chelatococcus]MBS7695952.1 mandelate racemase/muconate lactonizing enzyme family protein [Chelatococcus sp. YT9]MBX3555673.1 mandelate racemase/muconate lactonizing enzyme family protein [Chelatococcus sp.]